MARLLGPDMGSRYAYLASGAPAASVIAVVYANSAGTVLADIAAYQPGNPGVPGGIILNSQVTTDADGLLPYFWFPDGGVDRVWVSVNGGTISPIDADYNARVDHIDARGIFSVRRYGAVGDGVADDQAAILAAVAAAQPVKGTVYFPPGVYRTSQPVPVYSDMDYVGAGVGATVIRLANAANVDLLVTDQYATLAGGSTQAGPSKWSLRNMTLDGNGVNQTSGYVASIYGSNFIVDNVQFAGGKSGGVRSKWGTGGTNMESHWSNVKIYNARAGVSLDWEGPHDSVFSNMHVFMDSSVTPSAGTRGIRISGNGGGEQFTNVHVWGAYEIGWFFDAGSDGGVCYNCQAEGAGTNVYLNSSTNMWHGKVFGTNGTGFYSVPQGGPGEVGVRIGTTVTTSVWTNKVDTFMFNWVSGDKPIFLDNDNGSDVETICRTGTAAAALFGTASFKSHIRIVDPASPGFSQASQGFGGNGVPSNTLGVNGSYYQRWDGAAAGTHLYFKVAGAWVGITGATL